MQSKQLVRDTIYRRNKTGLKPFCLPKRWLEHLEHKNPAIFKKICEQLDSVPVDICWISGPYVTFPPPADFTPPQPPSPECSVDEWGTTWKKVHQVEFPIKEISDLANYKFPEVTESDRRFDSCLARIQQMPDSYALFFFGFCLFERYTSLRGFENHLMDSYINPNEHKTILEKIMNVNMKALQQMVTLPLDGILFGDDLGSQESLLIAPDTWRKLYKPHMKKMFDYIHDHNIDVWLHSDGNINEILPDLIEIGLNVLNPIQPQMFDIPELGKKYKDKLSFFGGLDVQYYLPKGTPQQMIEQYHLYHKHLGSETGGFIPTITNEILEDAKLENFEVIVDRLVENRMEK